MITTLSTGSFIIIMTFSFMPLSKLSPRFMTQVQSLEAAIADKKRQVERLVAEMKEANLESLAIAPADEVKHLLEGE
jgi:Ras association domain-containing protein 7/8